MPSPVVFITGCSSGIGKALCWAFHAQGYQVVATARHLEKLADLQPAGITTLALDVTDAAVIQQAIDTAIDQHHHIDILINNAGYGQFGPLMDISQQKLQAQFQTNVFATLAMAQQVAPIMKQQKAGRIINIGSISGIFTTPFAGTYCASKAALHSLSAALRLELAPFGIDVITVQPGAIQSNFGQSAKQALEGQSAKQALEGKSAKQALEGKSAQQASDSTLPKESWYGAFDQVIQDRTNLSQVNATPADEFATQLVKQIMQPHPPAIIRLGKKSRWLPWLKKWLPASWLEFLVKKRFGLQGKLL